MAGRPPVLPSGNLSYSENFLYMTDSLGNRTYKPNPRLARALDILFVLHAEHEMNCSTAAARHLASSGVDVYTALSGAVGALYGPLHGGANEMTRCLNLIRASKKIRRIQALIRKFVYDILKQLLSDHHLWSANIFVLEGVDIRKYFKYPSKWNSCFGTNRNSVNFEYMNRHGCQETPFELFPLSFNNYPCMEIDHMP
ncbi:uncharacterized protein [Primulina eburnea]|uniref:uncharacterized protein n=1 Tax=Primulina eburnea TaxID=1245227 RepID=UPI003C6CAF8B